MLTRTQEEYFNDHWDVTIHIIQAVLTFRYFVRYSSEVRPSSTVERGG